MKPKRRLAAIALALLTAVLLFGACTRGVLLHHYQPVGADGWARADTLRFVLPQAPAEADYEVYLGMRYTNTFPYEGIWVVAETRLAHPTALLLDTLYLTTADEAGRSLGRGVAIGQREQLLGILRLHTGQGGTIRLHHIMTREVVPDISDIGLRVAIP